MKQIAADLLNGVSVQDIKLILVQLLAAVILSLLFTLLFNKKTNVPVSPAEVVLVAAGVAFLVIISRYMLPVAVLSAAAVLLVALVKNMEGDRTTWLHRFTVLVIAVGCGSGYVALTVLFCIVSIIPALFLMKR